MGPGPFHAESARFKQLLSILLVVGPETFVAKSVGAVSFEVMDISQIFLAVSCVRKVESGCVLME